MTSHDIAAIVAAFDSIRELDACAKHEFVADARWMLQQRPDALVVELADRVRGCVSRLGLKQSRVDRPLSPSQALRYVAQCALDPTDEVAMAVRSDQQILDEPRRAEQIFNKHENAEMAKARAEWEASRAEREARPQQPDYAPPSVVARAFATAQANFPPRPAWAGPPPKQRREFEPSGLMLDIEDPDVRGTTSPIGDVSSVVLVAESDSEP